MQRALDCRYDPVRFTPGALLTRMATLAMHLVDEVLGVLPVEQGDEPGSLRPAVIPEHKEAAARRKRLAVLRGVSCNSDVDDSARAQVNDEE